MTKTKLEAYRRLYNRLADMGFDADEADALCRIERTLHRWAERECNGEIERDEQTGKTYYSMAHAAIGGGGNYSRWPIPDREKGALRRLKAIMASHPKYIAYHQTDPRGCALYIADAGENPPESISSSYTNGLAVCV